jgi:hypothetical protein
VVPSESFLKNAHNVIHDPIRLFPFATICPSRLLLYITSHRLQCIISNFQSANLCDPVDREIFRYVRVTHPGARFGSSRLAALQLGRSDLSFRAIANCEGEGAATYRPRRCCLYLQTGMYFPTSAASQLSTVPALPNLPPEDVICLAPSPRKSLFCTLTKNGLAIWRVRVRVVIAVNRVGYSPSPRSPPLYWPFSYGLPHHW